MSEPATRMATADAPALRSGPTASVYTLIGPGLLVAAAGLGAGDIAIAYVFTALIGMAIMIVAVGLSELGLL